MFVYVKSFLSGLISQNVDSDLFSRSKLSPLLDFDQILIWILISLYFFANNYIEVSNGIEDVHILIFIQFLQRRSNDIVGET